MFGAMKVGGVELGSVEQAVLDPRIDLVQAGGQGCEILLRGAIGGAVTGAGETDDEPARHALCRSHERVGVPIDARERARLQPRREEHEAAHGVKEALAPALGVVDGLAPYGIGRTQRRLRDELVQPARALP